MIMNGQTCSSGLLSEPLPVLANQPGVTSSTAETWALFQLITRVREVYGADLLGPVIISMTHSVADVLTVLLLARWTGCDQGLADLPALRDRRRPRGSPENSDRPVHIGYIPRPSRHLRATSRWS